MMNFPSIEELDRTAKAAFEKKDFSKAAHFFRQIVETIDPTTSPIPYAEARNNLSVALLKCGQHEDAFAQASGTDVIFAEHGLVDKQAMAIGNAGAALVELHQLDQALEYYQRAAALFKEIGNLEMRSYVLQEISVLQLKRGKQVESLFAMDAALQTKKKLSTRETLLKKLMKIVHRAMKTG